LRLARAFDSEHERERLLRRVMTSAAKFFVCKRGPQLAAEAMEVLGGNGYVEEGVLGRIYREMPVNSIWEGSGNIMCLDVLRAFSKSPQAVPILLAELEPARGVNARFDAALSSLAARLAGDAVHESSARALVCDLVLAMQAALLLRSSRSGVAEAFCESRLAGRSEVFGAQRAPLGAVEILDAAFA